jgi:hypothetical protein
MIIFEDGTLSISNYGDPNDETDDFKINIPHNFTNENGYRFLNTKVVAPNGTELNFSDGK